MEDYKKWEKKVEENEKRNEKFIKEFEEWLTEKGLVKKTIKKHLENIRIYINDYLNYYEPTKMENGITHINGFLSGWFIEKCLWASKNSIKETAASIKKFYKCMSEKGYVDSKYYNILCGEIKENMEEYIEQLEAYDDGTYFDMF